MLKKVTMLLLITLWGGLLALGNHSASAAPANQAEKDILETLIQDGRFDTLVQALETAALVETLEGEGPFTIFAPTDEAFARLQEETMERLLAEPANLSNVLRYHVVPGKLMAADLMSMSTTETLSAWRLDIIQEDDNSLKVNDAQVIMTDIETSNGVIHVIDSVLLLPPEELRLTAEESKNLVEIAVEENRFETLVQALETVVLVGTLEGEGPFTLFAPTDEAFARLPEGTLDGLLADPASLAEVLRYHVVPQRLTQADLSQQNRVNTLSGQALQLNMSEGTLKVNQAQVIIPDIMAANGILHAIDTVLLPPDEEEAGLEDTVTIEGVPVTCVENYVIQADDWLSKIANRYYGDPLAFPAIVEATNAAAAAGGAYDSIIDPDVIEIGQRLCIPDAEDAAALLGAEEIITGEELVIEENSIMNILDADNRFTSLAAALKIAGLDETLRNEGSFTLFAPIDTVFAELPENSLEELLADQERLSQVLGYHIVEQGILAAELADGDSLETRQGQPVTVTVEDDLITVNGALLIITDIQAGNGVIHAIDQVLFPTE